MGDKSKIEWTEATWNPVVGCSIVSPGCTNCYAMKMAGRIEAMATARTTAEGSPGTLATHYAGTTRRTKTGPVWTGELALAPDHILLQPLKWRRPRMIFVNSMGDLFHENVPDQWIDKVFAVMALCPHHTFQVLTKRAERMRNYFAGRSAGDPWAEAADAISDMLRMYDHVTVLEPKDIPLPNVWLGVSAEDQKRAEERIPHLISTPAAVRFVSAEPLLGPIDFRNLDIDGDSVMDAVSRLSAADVWRSDWDPSVTRTTLEDAIEGFEDWGGTYPPSETRGPGLDWIIVGGESGPGARPMHPDWARSIRDQCQAAGVPFFFKQWGEWVPSQIAVEGKTHVMRACGGLELQRFDSMEQLDMPGAQWVWRPGKRVAGRLLDGREHNEMPERAR